MSYVGYFSINLKIKRKKQKLKLCGSKTCLKYFKTLSSRREKERGQMTVEVLILALSHRHAATSLIPKDPK